jgi:uncharacterized UPF0160 family protein
MEANKEIKIVTHSGNFHPDDIFAVATLYLLLEKDHDIVVVRSRDKSIIDSADYVVDVGGEYDPARKRFDHHQFGGAGKRDNGVAYASFGLVWKEYGEKITTKEIAERMDQVVVQPIDALDNGFQFVDPKIKNLYPYDIGMIFDAFKPTWKEGGVNKDTVFMEMVDLAMKILQREIIKKRDKLEARSLVEKAYAEAEDKRIIVLESHLPYGEVLAQYPEPLFVIFPRDDEYWVLQTIQNDSFTFTNKKDLPAEWAGKSYDELVQVTKVEEAVFCHSKRFIAVAKNKKGILKMAYLALQA